MIMLAPEQQDDNKEVSVYCQQSPRSIKSDEDEKIQSKTFTKTLQELMTHNDDLACWYTDSNKLYDITHCESNDEVIPSTTKNTVKRKLPASLTCDEEESPKDLQRRKLSAESTQKMQTTKVKS